MLFWLSEALEVDRGKLLMAVYAAVSAPNNQATQAAAVRGCLPWEEIEEAIEKTFESWGLGPEDADPIIAAMVDWVDPDEARSARKASVTSKKEA